MKEYGQLRLEGRRWCMSGIEPHVALKLKAMFPGLDKSSTGPFHFAATPDVASDLEWFLHRYPMAMSDEDRQSLLWGRDAFHQARSEVESILLPEWTPPQTLGFREGRDLYHYQAQAVEMIRRLKRLLLMDDVGLGKTVSALGALASGEHLPAAIVVQTHLRTQWLREYIEKFTTLRGHIIKGTQAYTLPKADLYIFSYSNLFGWVDIAGTGLFRAVVYDELQELRAGPTTLKGRSAQVFSRAAEMRIGLSATPIYNYGGEIFNVMEFIEPGALGERADFLREWCEPKGGNWVVSKPNALGSHLRDLQLVLRRERAGQPVNTITIEVEYDQKVEADAADIMRALALRVVSGSFMDRGQAARELDVYARMVTGLAKARHVAAYVRMLLEAGQPVLLAGWHRDVYDVWMQELAAFNPVLYTGSETTTQKDKAKAAFIAGESDLMIISLRSGAGLDGLQGRCCTVVFGELDWSPKVHEQVIGRLDRPGQTQEVTAVFLHANGGSDPILVSTLGLKASQARGITDPMAGVAHVHSDDSRLRQLAEQVLNRQGISVPARAAPVAVGGNAAPRGQIGGLFAAIEGGEAAE